MPVHSADRGDPAGKPAAVGVVVRVASCCCGWVPRWLWWTGEVHGTWSVRYACGCVCGIWCWFVFWWVKFGIVSRWWSVKCFGGSFLKAGKMVRCAFVEKHPGSVLAALECFWSHAG